MVQTRQPTIDRAISRVDEEIDLVRTERNAFETFLNRIHDIQVSGSNAYRMASGPMSLMTVESSPPELRQIRQAYRETVMGVTHYDQEYGDTLRESVTEELGETLARHIIDGEVLTPAIHDALVEATETVRGDRYEFVRLLRRERESLRAVADELNDIEVHLVKLHDEIEASDTSACLGRIDETLQTLEQRCTDLATRRQERIHNRTRQNLSGVNTESLSRYLYGDMETVTPALADIASRLEMTRHRRTLCLR